jgi:N-acetylglutamate synthase-like GNAT family acetyltransferase
MIVEKMNPLFLKHTNFLVAEDTSEGKPKFLGCGQLRPVGNGMFELASIYVLGEARGAGVGSSIVKQLMETHAKENHSLV